MKNKYYLAWWNVENLFDTIDSKQRPEWLQGALKHELKGWTDSVLQQKIHNLASVIRQMNHGCGPDLLGICETENKAVIEKLTDAISSSGRNYKIAHHDSADQRGIDVAFIYDSELFSKEGQFSYVVLKRAATRDLFQVNFKTRKGRDLILIGNHWPARSAGEYKSEPYRIIAAETLSYWMQRILEIKGKDTAVVCMGDFNDEPPSRSLTDYALACNSLTKVKYARSPRLFNLMWPFHGKGLGTFYYNNFPFLFDQILVSKEMVQTSGKPGLAKDQNGNFLTEIIRLPEMVNRGRYPTARKFGRPSDKSSFDPDGYSDHFPVSVIIEE